jgi:hydrogenase nickel incorporation protein HypA/HybF
MHELTIASELLEQVLAAARRARVARVTAVEVRCGEARQVVPEALQAAFAALAEPTVAAGAELAVLETPLEARCRNCHGHFRARIDNYLCPRCGLADAELVAGDDIILQTVTGEAWEDDAA